MFTRRDCFGSYFSGDLDQPWDWEAVLEAAEDEAAELADWG